MTLKVVILGANGFIGSALTSAILRTRPWHVYAMDLNDNKLAALSSNPRFHFVEGDVSINREWIEYHVKKSDVVVPLVAIANPAQYVTDPLRVFELDFEANLAIVRLCVRYRKRLIFPSTSEVYGMAADPVLDEEESPFVYGPIHKQRWIYAASKQLLDRVIYAYGVKTQLDYTLIRPFNFIGPNLDNIEEPKEGSSRVFTQFLSNVMHRLPIKLVDGGEQKRSFTYIDDAIDCILRILENTDRVATRRIFNIGHPGQLCVGCRARPAHRADRRAVSTTGRARPRHEHRCRVIEAVLRSGLPGHPGPRPRDRGARARAWAGLRRRISTPRSTRPLPTMLRRAPVFFRRPAFRRPALRCARTGRSTRMASAAVG